jgi:hypothetical protein
MLGAQHFWRCQTLYSVVLACKVNSLMTAVATNETCRNVN